MDYYNEYYNQYLNEQGNEKIKNQKNFSGNRNYYDDDVVSIGTWILILILTAIPFINIIALLVLAFGSHNENLKNYAKAVLILMVIVILLSIFF
ncbi:hypothetical protein [Tenuibacillus multivorans]|uniref:Uncharacterized protein n=1 Tax=Tenuibacillus multivorans TaxID=237069 RepID=A0A1H0A111_9BACI|nr:hypothetical protein [Tenuibacillus multivorans]GEL78355.1 hypothetical protein TMU01_25900 [Tenuibacillus multivorans]SDN27230.1 hypothetical protein SAMN05216498_1920 [Tenuibacillus multivorans]